MVNWGSPFRANEITQVKEIMMVWRGILLLVLMGLAYGAEAAGPYFHLESSGFSQYINLSAVSAISHSYEQKARPRVTVWLIGSPNPIHIPTEQQANFWEAMRTHTRCLKAPNAPCVWPVGPQPDLSRSKRRRR